MEARLQEILTIIMIKSPIKISEILLNLKDQISIPTLNRDLAKLKKENFIISHGSGAGIYYTPNIDNFCFIPLDLDTYFKIEPDERNVLEKFEFGIFNKLKNISLFDKNELSKLKEIKKVYQNKSLDFNHILFRKEFERLMIELSWKSSQIEGNTYDLLDTEQLLKYNVKNKKYSQEDTQMLLNHKAAIEYTFENRDLYSELRLKDIIDIHSLVTQKMGISKNPRKRIVRITGTKYTPLDNEFQIMEALEEMCKLINNKSNVFEKSLLSLLLISYIQPFEDGNKRTARLVANAILMNDNNCPLSYRSTNPTDYKKAMLLFYELNNLSAVKKMFMEQYEFAVKNYF